MGTTAVPKCRSFKNQVHTRSSVSYIVNEKPVCVLQGATFGRDSPSEAPQHRAPSTSCSRPCPSPRYSPERPRARADYSSTSCEHLAVCDCLMCFLASANKILFTKQLCSWVSNTEHTTEHKENAVVPRHQAAGRTKKLGNGAPHDRKLKQKLRRVFCSLDILTLLGTDTDEREHPRLCYRRATAIDS